MGLQIQPFNISKFINNGQHAAIVIAEVNKQMPKVTFIILQI